jgi:hypothetical protein
MRNLCSHLNGWVRQVICILKKEKLRLSTIIDDLEALVEVPTLFLYEIELKSHMVPDVYARFYSCT